MPKHKKHEIEEARTRLRELLPPGSRVFVSVKHVSRSGMMRSIAVYVQGDMLNISRLVARAIDWSYDENRRGVKVSGCGMDMGLHLTDVLSYALHGKPSHQRMDTGEGIGYRWLD